MSKVARDFCHKAIAYLKVEAPAPNEPALTLSVEDSPVVRVLGGGLLVAYLVDQGESFSYVQHRHLQEANVDEEELHTVAVQNLAALAQSEVEIHEYGNTYAVTMGGNFEASLILVDEFWSEWCAHLAPNGFVAAFPARDLLAFGDAASAEAISELNNLCQRCAGEVDHPLTTVLYRRMGSSWQPFHG
jgi:uncharacterized protein YtpQ (UPF0354 family)